MLLLSSIPCLLLFCTFYSFWLRAHKNAWIIYIEMNVRRTLFLSLKKRSKKTTTTTTFKNWKLNSMREWSILWSRKRRIWRWMYERVLHFYNFALITHFHFVYRLWFALLRCFINLLSIFPFRLRVFFFSFSTRNWNNFRHFLLIDREKKLASQAKRTENVYMCISKCFISFFFFSFVFQILNEHQ